jgi:hypothetical protein
MTFPSDHLTSRLIQVATGLATGETDEDLAIDCLEQVKEELDPDFDARIDYMADAGLRVHMPSQTREWWSLHPSIRGEWRAITRAILKAREGME